MISRCETGQELRFLADRSTVGRGTSDPDQQLTKVEIWILFYPIE